MRDRIRGNPVPDILRAGQPLPEFSLVDENGNAVSSAGLKGTPAVVLFVRGTWCPFCSKQVADLTKYYKEITASGARLILITPKPLDTTRRVADFFEVEFEFWLDESLKVARHLGLVQTDGVPSALKSEYGDDTIWPASLVIDKDGIIRTAEVSRFIVDRPNPQRLLNAVRSL
jgi:peroxiredoxin